MLKKSLFFSAFLATSALLSGCAVVAVASAAVSTAATVVSTGVKVGGAVVSTAVDAVTPSDDEKKK